MVVKNKSDFPFVKSLLAVSISGILLTSTPVQALVLNADASYELPLEPQTDNATDSDPVSVSAGVNFSSSTGSASSRGAGNDTGWMYSRASGDGTWLSQARIQQSLEITNETGVDQLYSFDFLINQGSVSATFFSGLDAGEFSEAGNDVSILLNGASIFNSTALIRNDESGINLSTAGTVLGSYSSGSTGYSWGSYSDTLDLGVFAAGDSFTLTYDILTYSSGIDNGAECGGIYGDYGDYGEFGREEIGSGVCFGNRGRSQFGDPNSVNATPMLISSGTVTSTAVGVPEPTTLFLVGTGVAGLAFSRRKKNRQKS